MLKHIVFTVLLLAPFCLAQINNGGGGSSSLTTLPFDARNYGVTANTQVSLHSSYSASSSTINCTDCAFSSADVGKIIFGMNGSVLSLPQTTIQTVNSATQVTTVGQSASQVNNLGTAYLVWGTDDTAALTAAWTAATTGNTCGTVSLPAGLMLTQTPQFNAYSNCAYTNFYHQPGVQGQGKQSTFLVPTPNFNFTNCTGSGIISCFMGAPFGLYKHFAIEGFGYAPAGCANQTLAGNQGGFLEEMDLAAWCTNASGSVGLLVSGATPGNYWGGVEAFGNTNIKDNGPNSQYVNFVAYGSNIGLSTSAVGTQSLGTFFQGTQLAVQVLNGATWDSLDDVIGFGNISVSGYANVTGMNFSTTSQITLPVQINNGGTLSGRNSHFASVPSGSYAGSWAAAQAGATWIDGGGNTYSGTAVAQTPQFVQQHASNVTSTATCATALTNNTTPGSMIMEVVDWAFTAAQTVSVSDSFGSYTQQGAIQTSGTTFGSQRAIAVFYLNGTGAATHDTVTATISSSSANVVCVAIEFTGQVPTGSPFDIFINNTASGTSVTPGATLQPIATSEQVGMALTENTSVSFTNAGIAGQTVLYNGLGANSVVTYGPDYTSGTYTLTGTYSGNTDWVGFWYSLKPNLSPDGTFASSTIARNSTGAKFYLNADFTSANASGLQAIPRLATVLPSPGNWSFHCALTYSQATNVAGDQFGISASVAPTNLHAYATVATNTGAATPITTGDSGNITGTSATSIVTFQPGGTGTFVAQIDGTAEVTSAATLQFYVTNGTAADVIVVKRGSYCQAF